MVQQSPKTTPVRGGGTPRTCKLTNKQSWSVCSKCGIRTILPLHDCETPGVCSGGGVTKLVSTTKDTLYCHLHPDTMREMGVRIGTMARVGEEVMECWTDPSIPLSQVGCSLPDKTLVDIKPIDNIRSAVSVVIDIEGSIDKTYLPFLLQNRVIYPGQHLTVPYFSKNVVVNITSVTCAPDPSLSAALSAVSLSDQYYQITSSTLFTDTPRAVQLPVLLEADGIRSRVERIIAMATGSKDSPFGGMEPPRTLVVTGPSGTGKTLLCRTILQAADHLPSSVVSDFSKHISCEPTTRLLLLDALDTIKNDDTDRIGRVTELLTNQRSDLFILATATDIAPSLRKFFPIELPMPGLTSVARLNMFQHYLSLLPNAVTKEEVRLVATKAHGYVGADICNVCRMAVLLAEGEAVSLSHLLTAVTRITPRSMNEIKIEVPEVYWSQIGGLRDVQELLTRVITWPMSHAEQYKAMGITPPKGVLLYGPPGCCKTMMAKALATESGLNFLSVKGPELLSMYVGESERAVRDLFARARTAAPSIIFFDEIDALATHRGAEKGSGVHDRVLAQLLTELDGVIALTGVVVIAATNRPDRIDKALLRPGRLEKMVHVPLPDEACRREILEMKLSLIPHDTTVDIGVLVDKTDMFSGAEVVAVCHNAAISSIAAGRHLDMDMMCLPRDSVVHHHLYHEGGARVVQVAREPVGRTEFVILKTRPQGVFLEYLCHDRREW
eukprot:sb/3462494/